jgi:hypothetical protein
MSIAPRAYSVVVRGLPVDHERDEMGVVIIDGRGVVPVDVSWAGRSLPTDVCGLGGVVVQRQLVHSDQAQRDGKDSC